MSPEELNELMGGEKVQSLPLATQKDGQDMHRLTFFLCIVTVDHDHNRRRTMYVVTI